MSGVTTATVIAGAGLALSAASTAASFMGQMNQQAAQGAQANYMKQVALQRQQVADQQSADALARGQVNEDKQRQVTASRIGTQTAALAAQGTDLSGSPTDILGDTARAGEQDALTVRNNAAREAWGYKVQANNAGNDAGLYGGFQPSYMGAGASLLSGAGTLADKWSKFQFGSGGNDPVSIGGSQASYDISGGLV